MCNLRALAAKCPSCNANFHWRGFVAGPFSSISRDYLCILVKEQPEYEFSCEHSHLCVCVAVAIVAAGPRRSNCFHFAPSPPSPLRARLRRRNCFLRKPDNRARKTSSRPRKARKQKTCNRKTNCFCMELLGLRSAHNACASYSWAVCARLCIVVRSLCARALSALQLTTIK